MLLLLSSVPPSAPIITIQATTAITQNEATINVTVGGGTYLIVTRGLQYGTTPIAERETIETGLTWGGGAYSWNLTNLTPNTTYYFRVFAENSLGYTYSDWIAFSTLPSTYNVTIAGIDRTADILANTLTIEDVINDQTNTCSFTLVDLSDNGIPDTDDEVVITLDDGTKLFGGYVVTKDLIKRGMVHANLTCTDYTRLLDRNLVHKSYESMTDAEIIADIVNTYCAGFGISTSYVVEGVTIDQISFNYIQPSQAIRKIAELSGRSWYIDYDKIIHYFPLTTNATPFNIDVNENRYTAMTISKDASQLKNRVYVRGGTKLSDFTTYSSKGDGAKKQFVLPDKPHDVSVTVNGASKTVGIKNLNTSGYDWYLNYQEKYIEQDSGASALATTDTLAVTYKYDIPILVAVEDTDSIADNGQKEFAIFDKSISTTESARDRATAELTDYANSLVEGSFRTWTNGFRSGQYININLPEYDVNTNYLVQSVRSISRGNDLYEYEIKIASAKTLGIIKFLLQLLETNKNLVEIDPNEVVDELLNVTDALLSDSLMDSLTIDSAGLNSTWCTDSLDSLPATRARWNLFQWGA